MAQEGKIILPIRDNRGIPLKSAHDWLSAALLDAFGGCTKWGADGAWKDDEGQLHSEMVAVYLVAADPSGENLDTLAEIAREACRIGRQDAVYVKDFIGRVKFVRLNEKED